MNLSTKFLIIAALLAVALISGTTWGLAQGPPDNPGPPGRTLATLDCSAGQIAKFDGGEWICAQDMEPPSGAVVFLDQESCPEGWSALTEAQGRALVDLPPGGTLKGTVGSPLAGREDRPHNHTLGPVSSDTNISGGHSHGGSTADAGAHGHGGSTDDAGGHSHQGDTGIVEGHSHKGRTDVTGGHSHQTSMNVAEVHSHAAETNEAGDHYNTGHATLYGGEFIKTIAGVDWGIMGVPFLSLVKVTTVPHLHDLSGRATEAGSHTHTIGATSNAGAHDHPVSISNTGDHDHLFDTSYAGAHNHPMTIDPGGDHSHPVSVNDGLAHSHTLSTNGGGDHSHLVEVPNTISTEAAAGNVMPYLQLLVCRKD